MLSAVAARRAKLQKINSEGPSETTPSSSSPVERSLEPSQSRKRPSQTEVPKGIETPLTQNRKTRKRARDTRQVKSPNTISSSTSRNEHKPLERDRLEIPLDDSSADEDIPERITSPSHSPSAVPSKRVKLSGRTHAWSPSAPLPDSDETINEDRLDENDLETFSVPSGSIRPGSTTEPGARLSTFQPVLNQNVFYLSSETVGNLCLPSASSERATFLSMSLGEKLTLLGTYNLTVLKGTVTLCGTSSSASPQTHRVFAPRSSPLPVIECLASPRTSEWTKVSAIPEHLLECCQGQGAAILLQELKTGIEGLERICRTFDGVFTSSEWQDGPDTDALNLPGVQIVTQQTRTTFPMYIPPSWETSISKIVQRDMNNSTTRLGRQVYIVRGPKNSGKSTLARTLLNRLTTRYRRVAFLECDIGQSEFTPGGMVALNIIDRPIFGPSFTHPSIPYAAHFIGSTTPRSDPSHYLDCIRALIELYNLDVQNGLLDDNDSDTEADVSDIVPLVVNTMGWSKGFGSELAKKVEEIVEPSDIVEVDSGNTEEEWTRPVSTEYEPTSITDTVYFVESVSGSPLSAQYSAADRRTLSILSYFYAVFSPHALQKSPKLITPLSWTTSSPLCSHLPYQVDWRVAFDQIILAGAGMEDVVPDEVLKVLNCSIVGLVDCETEYFVDGKGTDNLLPYTQGANPPSPFHSTCHGLAIIRSLSDSPSAPSIHLLTPLPSQVLGGRVLVKGELELSVLGMLDFRTIDSTGDVAGVDKGKVPYLRWGKGEGAGGERRRLRRNLMRRGQM